MRSSAHVRSSIDSFRLRPSVIDQRDAKDEFVRCQCRPTFSVDVEILDTSWFALKHRVHSSREDHQDDDDDVGSFILDAKQYGSISRFYNHSCKPNVTIQNVTHRPSLVHHQERSSLSFSKVFIHSHDPRLPVIALFACRKIRAGEGMRSCAV